MPESLDCMFQQKLDDMLIPAAAQQTMLLFPVRARPWR
jgi:hypothetical protein